MQETKEVFRGHFEECLRHLSLKLAATVPKGSKEAPKMKQPIADFCGASVGSVTRWMRGGNTPGAIPVGANFIKLMCYLDMVGYRVIELERMPKGHRNFAELIGYNLLDIDDAVALLGYTNSSTLYQVLQGHQGISNDKDEKMWRYWKTRKAELQKKKEEALILHLATQQRVSSGNHSVPHQIVSHMGDLLALLEDHPLDKVSGNDLAILQRSANTMLRLSVHLNALGTRLIVSK